MRQGLWWWRLWWDRGTACRMLCGREQSKAVSCSTEVNAADVGRAAITLEDARMEESLSCLHRSVFSKSALGCIPSVVSAPGWCSWISCSPLLARSICTVLVERRLCSPSSVCILDSQQNCVALACQTGKTRLWNITAEIVGWSSIISEHLTFSCSRVFLPPGIAVAVSFLDSRAAVTEMLC